MYWEAKEEEKRYSGKDKSYFLFIIVPFKKYSENTS